MLDPVNKRQNKRRLSGPKAGQLGSLSTVTLHLAIATELIRLARLQLLQAERKVIGKIQSPLVGKGPAVELEITHQGRNQVGPDLIVQAQLHTFVQTVALFRQRPVIQG